MTFQRSNLSRVVAVANGKGGVGKTTLVAQLGGLAAAAGYKVLIIDLDPQGNIGEDLGYREAGLSDEGEHLTNALMGGQALQPVITQARENLDVIPGGERITDLTGVLFARASRGYDTHNALAQGLAVTAAAYDLVLIDTPPVDVQLQSLALVAARWLLVPTEADAGSIRGLVAMADRLVDARSHNPDIELLGMVLFGVPTSAARLRQEARVDIEAALGGTAPLFDHTIRASKATAREARQRGLLVHELADRVEGAEPFWQALRNGTSPERLPGAAPKLAGDYVGLADEVLTRINTLEQGSDVA